MKAVAVVLLLACLGVSSVAESGAFPYADGLAGCGDTEHPSTVWSTVAACKAECTQLQRKSVLHDVHYDSTGTVIYLASVATALACALVGALLGVWRVCGLLGKERAKYAAREAETRQREAGIKQQAAGLGEIAQEQAQLLLTKDQQLHNANAQLQVARRHIHQLQQANAQVLAAPATPTTQNMQCQTDRVDADTAHATPALVGEASMPQLDDLVAGAAANDTSKCASDQFCTPASAKSVHSLKPSESAALVELVANSRGTPIQSVVELLNQRLKEEGLCEQIQVQAISSSPSKAAPTITPSAAKAAAEHAAEQQTVSASSTSPAAAAVSAASPPSLLPLPSPAVAAAASFSAQQQQQVLPAVALSPQQFGTAAGAAGGSFVTRQELDSKLEQSKLLISIDMLKQKNDELKQNNDELKQKKDELRSELSLLQHEKMVTVHSGSGLSSGYVNASRGSGTPLPFGSTGSMSMTPGWGKFTPGASNPFQQFSAPRNAAVAVANSAEFSNSASSSCFRGLPVPAPTPLPISYTPAGSVGSTKQSAGQPGCTPASSATSCVSGRSAQVDPVPMQSLEAAGSPAGKLRSGVMQQPASPALKSAAHKLSEALDTAAAKSSKHLAAAEAKVAEVRQKAKPTA